MQTRKTLLGTKTSGHKLFFILILPVQFLFKLHFYFIYGFFSQGLAISHRNSFFLPELFHMFIAVYCQVAALLSTKSGQFQLKMAGRAYASRFLPALSSCNTQNYCQRMHRIFQSGHQWVKVKCSKGVTHISIFITKQCNTISQSVNYEFTTMLSQFIVYNKFPV